MILLYTVLADANFPSASICQNGPELVRADGHGIPPLLKAITYLFPLDTYVPAPVCAYQCINTRREGGGISSVSGIF